MTRQVIVTTHNAELLRHASLEDILLVTRNSDGNSEVTRPADSEVVRQFLQNELGVEDSVHPRPTGPVSSEYRRLFLLVEGSDDSLFCQEVLFRKFQTTFDHVQTWE